MTFCLKCNVAVKFTGYQFIGLSFESKSFSQPEIWGKVMTFCLKCNVAVKLTGYQFIGLSFVSKSFSQPEIW